MACLNTTSILTLVLVLVLLYSGLPGRESGTSLSISLKILSTKISAIPRVRTVPYTAISIQSLTFPAWPHDQGSLN